MIERSPAFLRFLAMKERIASFDALVLLEGETGTGKELAARAIHSNGMRRDRPFVPVNCGALPGTLVENELFGHRRGAFTDARDDEPGLGGLANMGTLFLDEVDALSLGAQASLSCSGNRIIRSVQSTWFTPVPIDRFRSSASPPSAPRGSPGRADR